MASASLACTLMLCGCTPPVGQAGPPGPAVVYAIDRGWHTDIGLPVDEISDPLDTIEQRFPGVHFLTFGFGERQYLLSRKATVGEMLGALLPSQSALLVTALTATPAAAFGARHVVVLHVSADGMARITSALWQALEKSSDGTPALLGDGPYPGSVFYAAGGTYDAFNTCNTWTAQMLHAGGLPLSPAGVLFSGQVMDMARAIAAQQASMRHG